MVYKLTIKIIFFYFFYFIPLNLYSNIVYDKENIVISDIDLNFYKQLYFENFDKNINNSTAIKNIVIIKNLIEDFKKNNMAFLKKLDENLHKEYGNEIMDVQMVKDFMRYYKIKNEYIYEYYKKEFNINDLKIIFSSFEKIELPISDNGCLTILKVFNVKDDIYFLENFYENLIKKNKEYKIFINDIEYSVCIDSRTDKIFEKEILNYIDIKTKDDFKKFVYER